MIKVIYSESKDSQEIMDFDKYLLDNIDIFPYPILHFYSWQSPTITYGYFIDPEKYLNLSFLNKKKIKLAKRPTGGGIIFHLWDMAFSFILPSSSKYFFNAPIDNYRFINKIVSKAYLKLINLKNCFFHDEKNENDESQKLNNFCMANPTKYDVMILDKKAVGAAERKTKKGLLHQASISLFKIDENIINGAILNEQIKENIYKNSFTPFEKIDSYDLNKVFTIKKRLAALLIEEFEKNLLL